MVHCCKTNRWVGEPLGIDIHVSLGEARQTAKPSFDDAMENEQSTPQSPFLGRPKHRKASFVPRCLDGGRFVRDTMISEG